MDGFLMGCGNACVGTVLRPQVQGSLWAGCVSREASVESEKQVAAWQIAPRGQESPHGVISQAPGCLGIFRSLPRGEV